MKKNVKNLFVSAAVMSMVSCVAASVSFCANADEIKSDAYILIREENVNGEDEKIVRYDGIDSSDNTISEGVKTASITKDDSYTVSIDMSKEDDFENIAEIGILQLYVNGTDETALADVEITVDALKIDGEEVELSEEPDMVKSEETGDYYVDLYNTNGTKLFENTDFQNIEKISIEFTVKGWPEPETEAPTEEKTEAPTEKKEEKKEEKTTEKTTEAKKSDVPPTGDAGVAAVAAVLAVSGIAFAASKRKNG